MARRSLFFSAVVSFDDRSPNITFNFMDLIVGDAVGLAVGLADGEVVGPAEGVGVLDGVAEGLAVGLEDGDADGVAVGLEDGDADGVAVGLAEGLAVGVGVGVGDGDAVEKSCVKASNPPDAFLKFPPAMQSSASDIVLTAGVIVPVDEGHETDVKPALRLMFCTPVSNDAGTPFAHVPLVCVCVNASAPPAVFRNLPAATQFPAEMQETELK